MPRDNRISKDPGSGPTAEQAAPRRPATSSESLAGEMEYTQGVPRKSVARSQVSDSNQQLSDLTYLQYRRIVAALEQGHGEKNIAESERCSERVVRRVRAAELDRLKRQMSAVGVAFGGFMETVRHLHSEIDSSVIAELQGKVA